MDLESLGKKPLSADTPCGSDVREKEEFLALQAQIDRSQSMTGSGATDWKAVETMATTLLDRMGKDLFVGCALSVALTRNRGPAGFLTGLSILNDLVEDYWEGLFPPLKRIRGRRNALIWWVEQLQELLPALEGPPLPSEDHAKTQTLLKKLSRLLGDKDPEGPMLNLLFPLAQGLPMEEWSEPAPTPAPPSEQEPAEKPLAEDRKPETSPSLLPPGEIIDRSRQQLLDASLIQFEDDFLEPSLYRYRRLLAWDPITTVPDSGERLTRIPAPPPPLSTALERLLEHGSLEDLLRFTEEQQQQYPFWLDMSYHSFKGLLKLEESGSAARLAIASETGYFTGRLPDLLTLCFSDETPFASPACRDWIASLSEKQSSRDKDHPSPDETLGPVKALLEERKLDLAVRQFQMIRQAASPRVRFLADLEMLSLVSGNGRDFPLEPMADNLLADLALQRHQVSIPRLAPLKG